MPPRPVEISDIVAMLSDRALALCQELLPAGTGEGGEWRIGSVAGDPGRSMAVRLSGPRAGVWCDWHGRPDDRGDALDLVAAVLFNHDKKRAIQWARAWLGLDRVDPASFEIQRRQAEAKKAKAKAEEGRRSQSALRLFLSAQPRISGTPAARYLAGRAIDFSSLGRQPGCLRFHPGLVHPETGEICPALVAAITATDGKVTAVHRTFLEILPGENGQPGAVVKLRDVKDAKLTLGRYAGGAIRLWRGATGKPWKDAAAGEWLMVGEGIEDTATAVIERPDLRAAAAVSMGNMLGMQVPDAIEGVIILAQNDSNPKAIEALDRAVAHFQALGKRVRLAKPDASVKDINELAQRRAAERLGAAHEDDRNRASMP